MVHSLEKHLSLDSKMKFESLNYSDVEKRDIALLQIFVWIREKMALLSLKAYYFADFLYVYSNNTFLSSWKRLTD